MDLLSLGSQARKTGIRPRQNLSKDKYNMEDIDEFFEDVDDQEAGGGQGGFNNFARKISFTDAEAENFNLSPISLSSKKKLKKSPLRSPLRDGKKPSSPGTPKLFLSEDDDEEEEDHANFNDDLNEDILDEPQELDTTPAPEPKPPQPPKKITKPDSNPQQKRKPKDKKSAFFTRRMALGSTSKTRSAPLLQSESEEENEPVRPSPLPSPPPDGLRRSKRKKVSPLAFWRGEKIVYSRADENAGDPDSTLIADIRKIPLQEIVDVISIPEPTPSYPKKAAATRRRSKSRTPRQKKSPTLKKEVYDYESDPEVEGSEWYANKKLELEVYESNESEKLIKKPIAFAPDYSEFTVTPPQNNDAEITDDYKIAHIFNYDQVVAGALIELPHEGFKTSKSSGNCVYMFHVVKGLIEVSLSNNTFIVTRGCSFQVPSGNTYGFTNVGHGSAKLFFVQTMLHRA